MAATPKNFVVEQGAYWRYVIGFAVNGEPTSMTGLKARMQIRTRVGGPLVLALSTDDDVNGHSYLAMNADATQLTIYVGATITDTWVKGGVYDLELYDPSNPDNVIRLMKGTVTIDKEVTV